jgi:hypothetical protein
METPTIATEVAPGVLAQRADDGGRDGDDQRDAHRQDDELERHRQANQDVLQHRPSAQDGGAPVAPHDLPEPDEVLHQDRLVEAVGLPGPHRVLLGIGVTEQGHDRITGDRLHHHEHHEGDHEDGRHDL